MVEIINGKVIVEEIFKSVIIVNNIPLCMILSVNKDMEEAEHEMKEYLKAMKKGRKREFKDSFVTTRHVEIEDYTELKNVLSDAQMTHLLKGNLIILSNTK